MNSQKKQIYIAATRQNDGKTACALGFLNLFQSSFSSIGYIKPVGQQVKLINNQPIDKDATLMKNEFHLDQQLNEMSPLAVPKGFTRDFIDNGDTAPLIKKIKTAFDSTSRGKDLMVIEGTGHAGVGSVFGLSNAAVAQLLDCKVIIVTCAGIGKPIDEAALNFAVFRDYGLDILGVVVNKVNPAKYDDINHYVRLGFKKQGIDVLGVLPFDPSLELPNIQHFIKTLSLQPLNSINDGEACFYFEKIVIPDDESLDPDKNTLILMSSMHEDWLIDNIPQLTMMSGYPLIIITNGKTLHKETLGSLTEHNIPVYQSPKGLYEAARSISLQSIKLGEDDCYKISQVKDIISKYIDKDFLFQKLDIETKAFL